MANAKWTPTRPPHRILVSPRKDKVLIILPEATYEVPPNEALRLSADLADAAITALKLSGSI